MLFFVCSLKMSKDTVLPLSQTVADLSAAVSSIQRHQERLLDTLVSLQVQPSSQSQSCDIASRLGGLGEFLHCDAHALCSSLVCLFQCIMFG